MTLSVLISVYFKDNSKHLHLALNSIWSDQVYRPDEIIIVKDGPLTNELNNVIENFSEIAPVFIFSLKRNLGLGEALKFGLSKCTNPYVARMDADDISYPNRFLNQMNFLKSNPNIDIVGSWINEFINVKENTVSVRKVPTKHNDIVNFLKFRSPFNHPSVIFKKQSVIDSGNYIDLYLKEDEYLWIRMRNCNMKFANLPECLLYFRLSALTNFKRGGVKLAKSELKLFQERFKKNNINLIEYIIFCSIKIIFRLSPKFIRSFFYKS